MIKNDDTNTDGAKIDNTIVNNINKNTVIIDFQKFIEIAYTIAIINCLTFPPKIFKTLLSRRTSRQIYTQFVCAHLPHSTSRMFL